jgi:hypothetical protein
MISRQCTVLEGLSAMFPNLGKSEIRAAFKLHMEKPLPATLGGFWQELEEHLRSQAAARRREALYETKVFSRVKRRARRRGILLRKSRPGSSRYRDLGPYYAVNAETDFIEATNVRLEDAALELGVIQPGEKILPG